MDSKLLTNKQLFYLSMNSYSNQVVRMSNCLQHCESGFKPSSLACSDCATQFTGSYILYPLSGFHLSVEMQLVLLNYAS